MLAKRIRLFFGASLATSFLSNSGADQDEKLALGALAARDVVHDCGDPLMLVIFCGLPGTGKTTLARALARQLNATYLHIDTIEDVLLAQDGASPDIGPVGYCVAYAVAEDNLKLGGTVVADSVNSTGITREAWRDIARRSGVRFVDVAVNCRDSRQHRSRIDARLTGTRGSDWAAIQNREFEAPDGTVIAIDTSEQTVEEGLFNLTEALRGLA